MQKVFISIILRCEGQEYAENPNRREGAPGESPCRVPRKVGPERPA